MTINQLDAIDAEDETFHVRKKKKKPYKTSSAQVQVVYELDEEGVTSSKEEIISALAKGISTNPNFWGDNDYKAVVKSCLDYTDAEYDLFVVGIGGLGELFSLITGIQVTVRKAVKIALKSLQPEQQRELLTTIVAEMPDPKMTNEQIAQLVMTTDSYVASIGDSEEVFQKAVEEAYQANSGTSNQPSFTKEGKIMINQNTAPVVTTPAADAAQARQPAFPFQQDGIGAVTLETAQVFPLTESIEETVAEKSFAERMKGLQGNDISSLLALSKREVSFTDRCLSATAEGASLIVTGLCIGVGTAMGVWIANKLIGTASNIGGSSAPAENA